MSTQRNAVQHGQSEQRHQDSRRIDTTIKETIEKCSRALGRGTQRHYLYIAKKLNGEIIPGLRKQADKPLFEYNKDLDDHEDWDWLALSQFCENAVSIIQQLENATNTAGGSVYLHSNGHLDGEVTARETVERTLESATCIAEQQGVVKGKYTKTAEAVGFSGMTLGRVYKDAKMPFDDPVEAIVDVGTIKSMFVGGTNTGKSTGAEGQFEDYYRCNFTEIFSDVKCIDPVDFSVGENIFYDVLQGDEDLRDAREEMDLPPDFSNLDHDPELEIFIPVSPSLDNPKTELPYDTEGEEFVPNLFVIPASTISQDLFVSVLTARVSDREEDTLREVYEAVDRERSEWTLKHLAEEIAQRDELSDKHQRKAIRVIRSLQDMGFVRESNTEYEIDWDRIFHETDTITTFNQTFCRNDREKLFVLAWILEQMWERRTETIRYPQMALMLRELWAFAPQLNRDADDDIAAALQERIVYLLTRFLRKNRDVRTHVVADTQNVKDINVGVREEFNRFCLFQARLKPAEKFFEWTGNYKSDSFVRNITTDVGECGIVGAIGPAYKHSRVEYIAPVAMTPPSHHHHDKDDGNGFLVRAEMVDGEQPLTPARESNLDWPIDIPESLAVPTPDELFEKFEEGKDGEDGDGSGSIDPIEYHREEARNRRANGQSYREIRDAIPNNPNTGNEYSLSTIKDWVEDIDPNTGDGSGNGRPAGVADD